MNPEHVAIVKQGKDVIHEWRQVHPEEQLDLSGADLSKSDLEGANLQKANLREANLSHTNLYKAELSEADLFDADLGYAILSFANISGADLSLAFLSNTIFVGANLSSVNLTNTDLRFSRLIDALLANAYLTGAMLYGSAREEWNVSGIKCQYVFWDKNGDQRSPRDRDLEPGEFERLYAQLPTIEYVFENGMTPLDPLVMDRIVQAINEKTPEFNLQIDSINARGLRPTIKFTVRHEEQKAAALEAVTRGYELEYAKLQGKYEELRELIYRVMDRPGSAPINIGSGSLVAIGGSSINLQEYIGHLEEIEEAIKEAPPETLAEAAKREALDTVSGAVKDVARGKVKEAVEAVCRLGVETVPHIVNTGAYQFFKNLAG